MNQYFQYKTKSIFFIFTFLFTMNMNAQFVALPKSFPKYMDTGNEENDSQNYNRQKKDWIAEHPAEYAQLNANSGVLVAQQEVIIVQQFNQNVIQNATHYPIMPATGDLVADEKAHIEAKNKWIKEYPEEYRKAGGNPEAVLVSLEPKESTKLEKTKPILPPFNTIKTYKLITYEAVSAENQSVSPIDLQKETDNIKDDFMGIQTELQIGDNQQIRLFEPERLDIRAIEKRSASRVEWFFENKECQSCSKTLYLTVEKESNSTISYIMQSEDEGALFAYHLVFQLTQ